MPFRDIKERDLVGRGGRFIGEGEVVLRMLLEHSRFDIETILLSTRRAAHMTELVSRVPGHIPVLVADDSIIEAVAGFRLHRGVLAVGLRGVPASARELIDELPAEASVLVGIGIANHDNMGGLFRNAAAFGIRAVLLDQTSCDPLYRKAIRVSVGGVLKVPFARGGNALPAPTGKQRHQQMEVGIVMAGKGQRGQTGCPSVDAQLFFQLADQGQLGRLTGINFAARKLPQAGQRFAGRALGQQNPAIGVNQRNRRDQKDFQDR